MTGHAMSCADFSEALVDFVDGTLDAAGQRALERHVEGCPSCRALVADLKSIQAAAFTIERLELPRHLWPAVQARVAAEPRPAPGRLLAWPPTRTALATWAAAAVLVLATGLGVYTIRSSSSHSETPTAAAPVDSGDPAEVVASVQAELQAAEAHYEKAIQGLEQIARSEQGALDPQVAAVLQKNLQVIDQAIGESRAALQQQPASAYAQESLFDAMRSKVALLQQTVELINEMRKGNQAEAGRLIQGLNQ
jgi:anti-sigma factor RsiW